MSTLKVNNLQVGQDVTAANNYTLYQPASPDGTVRLGYGVSGSVTDILTLKNSRLGIGTDNPEEDLHIASNSPYILLDDIDNSQKWKLKGTAWFAIEDTTSGVDRLRIDSSGRLLLGTTTPPSSANTLLNVHCPIGSSSADAIQISQNTNGADKAAASLGILVQNGGESTNAADLRFQTASGGALTEKLRITSAGDVVIKNPTAGGRYLKGTDLNGDDKILIGYETGSIVRIAESLRMDFSASALEPVSDNATDLGQADKRWRNIYSADLQLSNEGAANDVDGTWGQYTIQEGEDDLFLINRRNGKKYKFMLQEVN